METHKDLLSAYPVQDIVPAFEGRTVLCGL